MRRPSPHFQQKVKTTGKSYLDYVQDDNTMDDEEKKYCRDCFRGSPVFNYTEVLNARKKKSVYTGTWNQ